MQAQGGQEGEARVLAKVECQHPQVESVRLSPVPSKSVTLENRKGGPVLGWRQLAFYPVWWAHRSVF